MSARLELTGQKFNRLTAIRHIGGGRWECRCECGNLSSVKAARLRRGDIKSCGCMVVDFCKSHFSTHGFARPSAPTQEYAIWMKIKSRCNKPDDKTYYRYGARGIKMVPEWENNFPAFFAHIGPRPSKGHSVDRIDGTRGYEPGNVRWATAKEQCNNKSNNVAITWGGETMNLFQWAEFFGVPPKLLSSRLKNGWDFELAVISPVSPRKEQKTRARDRKNFLAATEPK